MSHFKLRTSADSLLPLFIRRSLFRRALFVLACATLVFIIITALIDYIVKSSEMHEELYSGAAVISKRIESSMRMPLWNLNYRQIDAILDIEIKDPDIVAIRLLDDTNEIAGRLNLKGESYPFRPLLHAQYIKNSFYSTSNEIVHNGNKLGKLIIYYSDSALKEKIMRIVLNDVLVIVLVGVLVITLEYFILRYTVLIPLQGLQQNVKKIAKKEFDTRIVVKSDDEIGDLARAFNEMTSDLEIYSRNMEELVERRTNQLLRTAKLASLGNMITGIAHEINTPVGISLTAVTHGEKMTKKLEEKLKSNSMKKSDLDSYITDIRKTFTLTADNLSKTAGLVQNFKKVGGDRDVEKKSNINVKKEVAKAIDIVKQRFPKIEYELRNNIADELHLWSYPGLLNQIISNLFANSMMHGFEENTHNIVSIDAFTLKNEFVLMFIDNGKGISPDNIHRIFDPFYTTRRNQGATGLGLNIVYNIVTYNMDGHVHCESIPFKETTFTVRIPQNTTS